MKTSQKFAILAAAALLSGCGIFNGPRLPSREGIVPGEVVKVQGNENIYAFARAHNVSMRDLIVLNDIHAPFTIHPGERLTLPVGHRDGTPSVFNPEGLGPAPITSVEEETLLPPEPALQNSDDHKAVAGVASVTAAPLPEEPPVSSAPPPPPTEKPQTLPPAPVKEVVVTPPPAPGSVSPPPQEEIDVSVSFSWPVQGPILSSFGPKGQGLSNDGINIGAPKGSPVTAAANGIVAYAGNEMKGFGNLVLIRHEGGWVTAYAHLDRIMVTKDATMAKGDMIGTVGATGNVSSPQLHFETRFKGKPVDPASVIKG